MTGRRPPWMGRRTARPGRPAPGGRGRGRHRGRRPAAARRSMPSTGVVGSTRRPPPWAGRARPTRTAQQTERRPVLSARSAPKGGPASTRSAPPAGRSAGPTPAPARLRLLCQRGAALRRAGSTGPSNRPRAGCSGPPPRRRRWSIRPSGRRGRTPGAQRLCTGRPATWPARTYLARSARPGRCWGWSTRLGGTAPTGHSKTPCPTRRPGRPGSRPSPGPLRPGRGRPQPGLRKWPGAAGGAGDGTSAPPCRVFRPRQAGTDAPGSRLAVAPARPGGRPVAACGARPPGDLPLGRDGAGNPGATSPRYRRAVRRARPPVEGGRPYPARLEVAPGASSGQGLCPGSLTPGPIGPPAVLAGAAGPSERPPGQGQGG